jgi:hypothetical protein
LVPVVLAEQLHHAEAVRVETQVLQRFQQSVVPVVVGHDLHVQILHKQPHLQQQTAVLAVLVEHLVAVVAEAIPLVQQLQQLLRALVPLQVIQELRLLTVLVVQVEPRAVLVQILLVQLDQQTQVMVVAVHLPRVQAVTLTVALVVLVY